MRKVVLFAVLITLLLSGCGTLEIYIDTTPSGNSVLQEAAIITATPEPSLSMSSPSEEIRQFMLESATHWKSVWMDGTVTNYAMDGTNAQTTIREQVWIDLTTNRFRSMIGPAGGEAEKYLASDGMSILEMDLLSGQSQSRPLPDFAKVGQFVPTPEADTAYPQPLWGQMGTPLSQLAFTSDFAQSDGTFIPVTTEFVAGREALAVDWTFAANQLPSWRMWLDTNTGVILKMQTYDKEGGSTIRSEAVVSQISFDDVFADALFGPLSSFPQFSDMAGTPLSPGEPAPPAPAGPDPLQDVYFFVTDHQYGNEKTEASATSRSRSRRPRRTPRGTRAPRSGACGASVGGVPARSRALYRAAQGVGAGRHRELAQRRRVGHDDVLGMGEPPRLRRHAREVGAEPLAGLVRDGEAASRRPSRITGASSGSPSSGPASSRSASRSAGAPAPDLLAPGRRRLVGRELQLGLPVVLDELVDRVDVGRVGRHAELGTDPERVDGRARLHELVDLELVEPAAREDPHVGEPRLVEQRPRAPRQASRSPLSSRTPEVVARAPARGSTSIAFRTPFSVSYVSTRNVVRVG